MNATVLIVDDQPDNVALLNEMLQLDGYDIRTAYNGQDALREIERARPDLVLLDIMMPTLNGIEVLKVIRRQPTYAHLPIVMLTARTDTEGKIEAWEIGADDYITKPFDVAEVRARIRAVLRAGGVRARLEEMNRRETRLRSAFQALPYVLAVTDVEGRVVVCTRMAEQVYGFRSEDAMGQPFIHLWPPTARSTLAALLERALKEDQPSIGELRHVEGGPLLRLSAQRLTEGVEGPPIGVLWIAEEPTAAAGSKTNE